MKKYILMLAVILLAVSCKKGYLDINNNPNTATESSVSPQFVLPRAMHSTAGRMGAGYTTFARWCGQWSRGGDFGPNVPEENYQITASFGDGTWGGLYDNANDYNFIEKKAKSLNQNFYQGIAKVMKVIPFYEAVDIFNNVPYSKAFDLSENILPKYDKGPAIYQDFFVQLDQGLALINGAGADEGIASADIMFNGNKTKWRKFINTLRLKLILRLVNTTGVITPATEFAKITSDGFIGASETAAVNPGYKTAFSASNVSQQNPFWDNFKLGVNGTEATRSVRANNFTVTSLVGASDPRLQRYFSPTVVGGLFVGSVYGQNVIPLNSDNQSGISGPGLAVASSQNQWLLTSVESLFLQAEAKLRYPSAPIADAPAVLFDKAVKESFAWLGVPSSATAATTYLASNALHTNPASVGGGTVKLTDFAGAGANQLETLMHQKYFSLVGIANFEIYADYRRTGYPKVPRSANSGLLAGDNIPKRYLYPQTEYNVNSANVSAEGAINAQANKIFWAQ